MYQYLIGLLNAFECCDQQNRIFMPQGCSLSIKKIQLSPPPPPQRCSVHNRDGVMFLDYNNNQTVSAETMST